VAASPGRRAEHYRRRRLDPTAARMIRFLEQLGIVGATVLEVGGGVGEIQIELLRRRAARAVNLELSPAYQAEAENLLREAGFEDRAERMLADIAVDADAVEPATWSCSTGWSAAIRTTSDCWRRRRPATPAGCSSSAIRPAMPSPASFSAPRT
jgi:hypothetical protein